MTRYAPILHHLLQSEICKIHWKNVYFSFMAPFRKLYLASSALSHGSEAKFSFFCTASGLVLWKNARRIRYIKSESSCNTCFGSPTYKQINTISVLFPAVQAVTVSSSCNRRLQIACFLSPIGNCMQSINWWAAVCPPERAFNWIKVAKTQQNQFHIQHVKQKATGSASFNKVWSTKANRICTGKKAKTTR